MNLPLPKPKLDPLHDFTPERWLAVRGVLSGDHDRRVSLRAAAKAAGVPLHSIRRWHARSEQQIPTDDPLVHEIAPFIDEMMELQAGRLEDLAWERAVVGDVEETVTTKADGSETVKRVHRRSDTLLLKLLRVRDERYKEKELPSTAIDASDAEEIYCRLLAAQRMAETKAEARKMEKKTVTLHEQDDGVFRI